MNKYSYEQVIEFQSFRAGDFWKRGKIDCILNQKGEISYMVIGDDGQRIFRTEDQIRGISNV